MRGKRHWRVRWGDAGRAAAVLALLGLAIAWPRLAPPPPRLPSDAGIPVAPHAAAPAAQRERGERGKRKETVDRRRQGERSRAAERRRRAARQRRVERLRSAAERKRQADRRRTVQRRRRRTSERPPRTVRPPAVGRGGKGQRAPVVPRRAPSPAPPSFHPTDPATTEFSFERR